MAVKDGKLSERHDVKDGKNKQEDHGKHTGDFNKTQRLLTFFLVFLAPSLSLSFFKHRNQKPSPNSLP